MNNTIIVKL